MFLSDQASYDESRWQRKYVADDSEILVGAEERDIRRRKKYVIKR